MKKSGKAKIKREDLLRNLLPKHEALEKVMNEKFKRITLSLYRYVHIDNPKEMRDLLWKEWSELECLGRIYIAKEGINAQMSVPEHNLETFREQLYAHPEFKDVPFKIGIIQDSKSFWKLNIKVKKNIVADGLEPGEYDITNVGNHLNAEEFNEAMEGPNTVVVDMRNHYESEIGHFEDALCHEVSTFKEQLPLVAEDIADKKDAKLLLYCTGGIRCEKASAYFKDKGFKDVNQLHGGVISYKHEVEAKGLESKFKGSNYVFDGRDKENINGEIISHCHQCDTLSDQHVNCANKACNLLFLQCDSCQKKMNVTCGKKCMKISLWPEEKQKNYYRKMGDKSQRFLSKSPQAKKLLKRKTPIQRIKDLIGA